MAAASFGSTRKPLTPCSTISQAAPGGCGQNGEAIRHRFQVDDAEPLVGGNSQEIGGNKLFAQRGVVDTAVPGDACREALLRDGATDTVSVARFDGFIADDVQRPGGRVEPGKAVDEVVQPFARDDVADEQNTQRPARECGVLWLVAARCGRRQGRRCVMAW